MSVKQRKIRKVLIANRGEIALRIIRTVKELDLEAIAVYEKPDSESNYIRSADVVTFTVGLPVEQDARQGLYNIPDCHRLG